MYKYLKATLKEVFQPKLFTLIKSKTYTKKKFTADLIAGLIVGIVAIPLAIAFAIASGVSPAQGLITAIIAGFIVSFLGGSSVQIGGPTGAFIVIVYGIVLEFGMSGLMIATILAGILLIAMGLFKLGNIIRFMPYPIIVGFTSGIAIVIFSSQVGDILGLEIAGKVPADFIDKWIVYFKYIGTTNWIALLMSVFTVLIIAFWDKITKKVPGSLIAILLMTVISVILDNYFPDFSVSTIGSKFPELVNGAMIATPEQPPITMKMIRTVIQPAFTIAILCAVESLLSAVVADGIIGKRHNSNTELIAQGVANVITPMFGGIPATGAIARTMANIKNGGRTPVAGIIHAVVILLIFLLFMPLAVNIPLPCLAGVLVIVAYNMSEWRSFRALLNNPRSDVVVLLVTFFLTVFLDLTIAIEVGLVIALVMFFKRVTDTSGIEQIQSKIRAGDDVDESTLQDRTQMIIPDGIEVFEINGPFAFGIANKFIDVGRETPGKRPKVRILRMQRVPFIDSTGIQNLSLLHRRSKESGIQLILTGVILDVYKTLYRAGFVNQILRENMFVYDNDEMSQAIGKAKEVIAKIEEQAAAEHQKEKKRSQHKEDKESSQLKENETKEDDSSKNED